MGVVYLAEDTRLGRQVAIKALAREYGDDPERRKRFLNEARAAAALTHASIAAVFQLEERGADVFIIFEYVEGITLRALLQAERVKLDELLAIAVQVASALEAAHARGIVHRDLKPENVMRRPDGEVKVLDFGLARIDPGVFGGASTTQSYGLTQAGTVMGTVGYMSPEQLEGKPTDFRSDIFSFGVILYELATGAHPFAGETPASTIARVMTQEPPPLNAADALHPPELERIVRKCLRKSRADRYQSTRDLLVDLKQLKRDSGERLTAGTGTTPAPTTASAALPRGFSSPRGWLKGRIIAGAVMAPTNIAFAWFMKDWIVQPFGTVLFFSVVVCMAITVALRFLALNLLLWHPEELGQAVAKTAPWTTLLNVAASVMLLIMAAQGYKQHPGLAAFVTFTAIGAVFLTLAVEPMMLRRAFPQARSIPESSERRQGRRLAFAQAAFAVPFPMTMWLAAKMFGMPNPPGMSDIQARMFVGGLAAVGALGFVLTITSALGFLRAPAETARQFQRFFLVYSIVSFWSGGMWSGLVASVANYISPDTPFMLVVAILLPPLALLGAFYERRLARELAPPADSQAPDARALTLAAIEGMFAAMFAALAIFMADVMRRMFTEPNWETHHQVVAVIRSVLAVIGFVTASIFAVQFLRMPAAAARHFRQSFVPLLLLNMVGGIVAGAASAVLLGSYLLAVVLPVAALGLSILAFFLSRQLAPVTSSERRFNLRSPQAWWIAHNFANLLVVAGFVVYLGSFTRRYYGAAGKLAFFALILLVGARGPCTLWRSAHGRGTVTRCRQPGSDSARRCAMSVLALSVRCWPAQLWRR